MSTELATTVAAKLATIPAPDKMLGVNLTKDLIRYKDHLASIPAVEGEDERAALDALLKGATGVRKVASEKRLEITRILDEMKSAYMTAEKEGTADLDSEIAAAKTRITAYLREEDRKAQAERDRIAAEQAKVLARKRAPESIAAVQAETEEKLAAVAGPSDGVKRTWTYAVTDRSQMPSEYLIIDSAAIQRAIREGVRQIPGVRIYQEIGRSGR